MVKHTRTKEEERRCCPPEKPIDNNKTSEKVEYANYVRNTKYKEVVQGRAQNVEVFNVASSSVSVRFKYVGYPRQYIYQIEEPIAKTTARYTVDATQGTTFTFNGLQHNTRYFINVFVKYVTTTPYGLESPISIRTPNELYVTDFILSARNVSVNVDFAQSPSNPKKYVVYLSNGSNINRNQTIENVFFSDYQEPRKRITFENLDNNVTYSVYIESIYLFEDGSEKPRLRSATKTITTLKESSVQTLNYYNITGNSVDISFQVVEPNNVIVYNIQFIEQIKTDDGFQNGNVTNISSPNSYVSVNLLKLNTNYKIQISNTYNSTNEYVNTFNNFRTRNERAVTNITENNIMYNEYGTVTFLSSPFIDNGYPNDLSYITYDISYSESPNPSPYPSLYTTVYNSNENIDEYNIGNENNPVLKINTIYYFYVRTTYYHGSGQHNVYDASGIFQTLFEGPIQTIQFTDINAYDVNIKFIDVYTPLSYNVQLIDILLAKITGIDTTENTQQYNVYFDNLKNNNNYDIRINSVFENNHVYTVDVSFNTLNEGLLNRIDFYHYDNSFNVFIDIYSSNFDDISNNVHLYLNNTKTEITFDASYIYETNYFPNGLILSTFQNSSEQTLSLHGVDSLFYIQWEDYKDQNTYDVSYVITISNEHGFYKNLQVPAIYGEESIKIYNTKRSQLINLNNKTSHTTVSITNTSSNPVYIENVTIHPVAHTYTGLTNNTIYDISLTNFFVNTNNSYTYETKVKTHNDYYVEDVYFLNHTGYTFDFEPSGNIHNITYYNITQTTNNYLIPYGQDIINTNNLPITIGGVTELTPDTSYTLQFTSKFIQLDLPFYPSYHYYVNYFETKTLNESRIKDISFYTIRANSAELRESDVDVSNILSIESFDFTFVQSNGNQNIYHNIQSLTPYYLFSGLTLNTSYSINVVHTYNYGNKNQYTSTGFSLQTAFQSSVVLLKNFFYIESFVHRVDFISSTNFASVYIKFLPAIGNPSGNTFYVRDVITNSVYSFHFTTTNTLVEFDFSGVANTTIPYLIQNQKYEFYVDTSYSDGNVYRTIIDDVSMVETNIFNSNNILEVDSSLLSYDTYNKWYNNIPTDWVLKNGYMAYDTQQSDPNLNPTIIAVSNTTIHGFSALLNYSAYPYEFSSLEQPIELELLPQTYEIRLFAANIYDPNVTPQFIPYPYQPNTYIYTHSNIKFDVFLQDIVSGNVYDYSLQSIETNHNTRDWYLYTYTFPLNMSIPPNNVKIVIQRTGYEYNILGIMNVQLKVSGPNTDYSVGILRNINNDFSLIYNVEPILPINDSNPYKNATNYNVRVVYENVQTNLTLNNHALYVTDVSNGYVSNPILLSGNVNIDGVDISGMDISGSIIQFPNAYSGLQKSYLYSFYIESNFMNPSSSYTTISYETYILPYRSPVLFLENSEGDDSLIHKYLQNSSLDGTYRVEIQYQLPYGNFEQYINRLYIRKPSSGEFVEANIPSNVYKYIFNGTKDGQIPTLEEDITYTLQLETIYNDGRTYITPEFDFSANFNYTLNYIFIGS